MRKLLIATLVVGQTLGQVAPALAQDFALVRETEMGAFGGVTFRVPFGGASRERASASLAFAPTTRADYQDGRVRTRIGRGLEFGYRANRPLGFSLAGQDMGGFRLNALQDEGEGQRRGGGSTGRTLLIVGGVLVVAAGVGLLVLVDAMNDASE